MIGNDIVDLKLAFSEGSWKRQRYLNKIFTPEEQRTIEYSENNFQMIWLLWSMKESAYKIHIQRNGEHFFNPKKLECQLLSQTVGIVRFGDCVFKTSSTITEDFIHTIAFSDESRSYKFHSFQLENSKYNYQHSEGQRRILKALSETKLVPLEILKVEKNAVGVPRLFQNGEEQPNSFSMTHHGHYGAYAIANS